MDGQDDPLVSALSSAELAHAAVLVDDMLLKAAGASAEARFQAMELRLFRRCARAFLDHAEDAVKAGASGLDGDGPATPADVARITRRVATEFRGWERGIADDIRAVMEEAHKLGKEQMADRLRGRISRVQPAGSPHLDATMIKAKEPEIISSFNLIDRQAVDAMAKRQIIWVGDHYDNNLADRVQELVRTQMLETGLGRREAGKLLRAALAREFGVEGGDRESISLPPGWAGPTAQYFEGLAANTVTQARVRGAIQQMVEVQVTRYEVVNPLDERTCERCRYMDGKTFEVRHAANHVATLDGATDPDEVRERHPWPKGVDELKLADAEGALAARFPLPSYHFRCRCSVDIAEDAEFISEPAHGSPAEIPEGFRRVPGYRRQALNGIPAKAKVHESTLYVSSPAEVLSRLVEFDPTDAPDFRRRIDSIKRAWTEGKELDPVRATVMSDGQVGIVDGRHRLRAALELGMRVLLRLSRDVR